MWAELDTEQLRAAAGRTRREAAAFWEVALAPPDFPGAARAQALVLLLSSVLCLLVHDWVSLLPIAAGLLVAADVSASGLWRSPLKPRWLLLPLVWGIAVQWLLLLAFPAYAAFRFARAPRPAPHGFFIISLVFAVPTAFRWLFIVHHPHW